MRAPFNIMIDTPNYVVRTLEEHDDMGNWGEWLDDPNTARMLNARPKNMTADDFKDYVRAFDRIDNHLLGIFRREGGLLIGMWSNYINWERSEFLINLIIGDVPERKTHVRHETSWRVNRYFFEHLDLRFQHAATLATNIPRSGRSRKRSGPCRRAARSRRPTVRGASKSCTTRDRARCGRARRPMSDAALLARDSAA